MHRSIKQTIFYATAMVVVASIGLDQAHAGGGSGWGWAKPLNKRLGAFYTSNRNANFSRQTRTRTTYQPKTYRQPTYQSPVYQSPVYHQPVNRPPVVITQTAPVIVESAGTVSDVSSSSSTLPMNELPSNELPSNESPSNESLANQVLANEVLAQKILANEAVEPRQPTMTTRMAIEHWNAE